MTYSDATGEQVPVKEDDWKGSAFWNRGVHRRCQRRRETERREPLLAEKHQC
jgi:hypothetical protein